MLQKRSFDFHSNCQNTLWTFIKCSLRFVILDNTRKRPKSFLHRKDCLFLSKVCVFQQPLRCYRSDLITSTVNVGIPFGPLQIVDEVCHNRLYEKEKAKIISYWKDCFFSKICDFQQPLRCYRSDLITSTKVVGIPFGALQTVPWVLSPSIIREKKAKTFFSLERLPFLTKLYVLQQLFRCYRSDLITSTKIAGIPFGPL